MNKKSKLKNKHWLLISPYLFSLDILMLFLYGGVWIFVDAWLLPTATYASKADEIKLYIMFNGLPAALFIAMASTGYEFFGFCCICEDCIKFYSLSRFPRTLCYSDINYVGIDFGMLSVTRQYWIYFSKTRLPYKYHHRINRVKFTKDTMRIQYSKKAYDILLNALPRHLEKQLNNGYSILRTYHEED